MPRCRALAVVCPLLLSLVSCTNAGTGTGQVDGTGGGPCDGGTGGPAATSGGDHGPPYEFGNAGLDESGDDGGSGVYPDNNGDPTGWEYDSTSGIYYRRTTAGERAANHWHDGSLLVVDSGLLDDVLTGQTADLSFPLALEPGAQPSNTLTIETVTLKVRRTSQLAPVYTFKGGASGTPTESVRRPLFYTYFAAGATQSNPGDVLIRLVAEQNQGFSATLAMSDRRVAIRGPFVETKRVTRIDIDPPVGSAVILVETSIDDQPGFLALGSLEPDLSAGEGVDAQAPSGGALAAEPKSVAGSDGRANQCSDGLDNDPDGRADNCDYDCLDHPDYGGDDFNVVQGFEYTKNIAMVPDISLCTCNPAMCAAMLVDVGEAAAQLLNQLDPPASMEYSLDTRAPPLRVRLLHEFIHTGGCGSAESCDSNATGSGCPSGYPFASTAGDLTDMRPAAWDAVDLAAAETSASAEDLHPVSLVGVLAATNNSTDAGVGGYDPLNGFHSLGAAVLHYDSDVGTMDQEVAFNGLRLAHEFGHCFGLRHDNAQAHTPNDILSNSFMHPQFPGPVPILGGTESGTEFIEQDPQGGPISNWEIWAIHPWDPLFPRASGFGHTGCANNAECQTTEFPNLVCGGPPGQEICL